MAEARSKGGPPASDTASDELRAAPNSKPRMLIVCRQFWPAMNDQTLRLFDWCESLASALDITVLAEKGHESWPTYLQFDRWKVERVAHTFRNPLRALLSSESIYGTARARADEFDLVWIDGADADAHEFLREPGHWATVVRFDPHGYPQNANRRMGAIEACKAANYAIVPDANTQQELEQQGVGRGQMVRVGVWGRTIGRTIGERRLARQILRDSGQELALDSCERLVVCVLDAQSKTDNYSWLRVLGPIVEKNRSIRVWVLTEGRVRSKLYRDLKHHGWHHQIVAPGIFTDLEVVLQAADLCLISAAQGEWRWQYETCTASRIPALVVSDESSVLQGRLPEFQLATTADLQTFGDRLEQWSNEPNCFDAATLELHNTAQDHRQRSEKPTDLLRRFCRGLASGGESHHPA